jgi:hypothetical protein
MHSFVISRGNLMSDARELTETGNRKEPGLVRSIDVTNTQQESFTEFPEEPSRCMKRCSGSGMTGGG